MPHFTFTSLTKDNKTVLVFVDWFDPAYKAGGPIRSIVNFVEHLYPGMNIYILTGGYDLGEKEPLSGIELNQWTGYKKKAMVYYASGDRLNLRQIRQLIHTINPDYIYLNSFFSLTFSIFPLILKWAGLIKSKCVLAPRGMLKDSALAFKKRKKQFFILLFKWSGIARKIRFQATDAQEQTDIKKYFGRVDVVLAPNLPGAVHAHPYPIIKSPTTLKILFVGRIHPIKNLKFLLTALQVVKGEVVLTIIGPLEDQAYWQSCQAIINSLPSSIQIAFLGEQPHDRILNQMQRHHIFALPTRGENFGHAIFEALSNGRPVLISDQTPWRDLQARNAGWDLSLQTPEAFSAALQQAVDWDQQAYDQYALGALQVASGFLSGSNDIKNYHLLFN